MHSMLLVALTTAFLLTPKGRDEKADAQARMDDARLQGKWAVVAIEYEGEQEKLTGEDLMWTYEFCGTSFTSSTIGRGEGELSEGTFRLHLDQKPPVLEITCRSETGRASYKLDGDTLIIVSGEPDQPRPTDFHTKPGDGRQLVILKRMPVQAPAKRKEKDEPLAVRRERAKLEGAWHLVESENKGKRSTGENEWLCGIRLVFKGDVVEHWLAIEKGAFDLDAAGTYAVLTKQNPKGLDFAWTSKSKEEEDEVAHAIYKVEGDTLTICMTTGKERPTSFDTRQDADWVVMVCKRKKP